MDLDNRLGTQPQVLNYDVSTPFAKGQWELYKHAPRQLNREWSEFRKSFLLEDRGYNTLTDPNMGTLLTYDEWFNEFKDWSIKSADYYPETKIGVQLMEDVDEKLRKDTKRRINVAEKRGGYFKPEDLPPIIDNLGREHVLLNREIGAAGLRYATVVRHRDIKQILEGYGRRDSFEYTGMINVLDVFLDSWADSFPPNPFAFYRLAFMITDAYQPENQQILPRLLYESRNLESPINNDTPNIPLSKDKTLKKLREDMRGGTRGQKLCPSAFIKIIAGRPEILDYSEKLKEGVEDIGNKRRISKRGMHELYEKKLFSVPETALRVLILSETNNKEETENRFIV